MPLPSSGNPISLSQVNTELGYEANATIELAGSAVRCLFEIASGTITMFDGLGKNDTPVISSFTSDGFTYDTQAVTGDNRSMSVTTGVSCGTDVASITYQWEYRTRLNPSNLSSNCWQSYSNGNLSDGGQWSGTSTNTLTLLSGINLDTSAQSYAYWIRCKVTRGIDVVYTDWTAINFAWEPYVVNTFGIGCSPVNFACDCYQVYETLCCCFDSDDPDESTCCDDDPECTDPQGQQCCCSAQWCGQDWVTYCNSTCTDSCTNDCDSDFCTDGVYSEGCSRSCSSYYDTYDYAASASPLTCT